MPCFAQISQFYAATDKIYYNTSSQKCSSDLNIKTMIYTLLETLKKTNFRESKEKLRKLWKGLWSQSYRLYVQKLINYLQFQFGWKAVNKLL